MLLYLKTLLYFVNLQLLKKYLLHKLISSPHSSPENKKALQTQCL